MGITAPKSRGFLSGLSTAFATGAGHKLEKGAVVKDVAALHVRISHISPSPSISTQIAALRRLLLGSNIQSPLDEHFRQVASVSSNPIVVFVSHLIAYEGFDTIGGIGRKRRYNDFSDILEARGRGTYWPGNPTDFHWSC